MNRVLVGSLGVLILIIVAGWGGGLRINLTTSLPVGIYRITGAKPDRGAIVIACLPPAVAKLARARGYVRGGGSCAYGTTPVGKVVLAQTGDTITVTSSGTVLLNGRRVPNSEAHQYDRRGRRLPHLPSSTQVLGRGELWLLNPCPRSFDSRYFGAVDVALVRAVVRPVWTVASR